MEIKVRDVITQQLLFFKLNEEELKPILDEIKDIESDFSKAIPYNLDLAGNIKKEYSLTNCKSHIETLLTPLVEQYEQMNNILGHTPELDIISKRRRSMKLNQIWVNFQQKGEFNPIHRHAGILSFVLWIKIPFTRKQELDFQKQIPEHANHAGIFNMLHSDFFGNPTTINIAVDSEFDGSGILFPARTLHSVDPFYSTDEYRISVSGNFTFDT